MKLKKLPLGIYTLKKIIEEDYLYIDKTKEALDLITNYTYAFLSRPRRFGKSLFLNTLKKIFLGDKELFQDLYIYDKWDFKKYPVIHINFAGDFKSMDSIKETMLSILKFNQKELGIYCEESLSPTVCFDQLIKDSYHKYNMPVVILVDEYDKPINDNLENIELAMEAREFLKSFYEIIKANDSYIKFAFLTGVSKFSKAGVFSGLNVFSDISYHPDYGNICGYTKNDLETTLKEHLKDVDLEKLKNWYNGYNFLKDKIYNPYGILQFISNQCMFDNYWFNTGTPSILIKLLDKNYYNILDLENITIAKIDLEVFDVANIKLDILLLQTGYLTIDKRIIDEDEILYKLRVPNKEVSMSLNYIFFQYLTKIDRVSKNIFKLFKYLKFDEIEKDLTLLFDKLPHQNYKNNDISNYEGYYASVFYAYLASAGIRLIGESSSNNGDADLVAFIEDKIYIIEFKVNKEKALNQIKEKGYHKSYLDKEVYIIGINFDKKERNIKNFVWEKISTNTIYKAFL